MLLSAFRALPTATVERLSRTYFGLIALSFLSNKRCVFAVTINLQTRLPSSTIYTINCHLLSLEYSGGNQMRGVDGLHRTNL